MPARWLNVLGLLGTSGVLIVAFYYQLLLNELPCPLCLLQRAAFLALGLGFVLNLRFGSSPAHNAMMLVSAVIGAATAARQVFLHILPGDQGYGSALLGMHFYSWAFVAFAASILYVALLLLLEGRSEPKWQETGSAGGLAWLSIWLFALLIAGNFASTLLECGIGPCADNPTAYEWLQPK